MWALILIALFLLLFLFVNAQAQDARKMAVSQKIAKRVIEQWKEVVKPYCRQYGVPVEKALSHIAVESAGEAYALRNDALKESYYAKNADDAFLKLSEWERKGFLATSCSIGPMQVVPKWGLVDFNKFYYRSVQASELISDLNISVEVGIGFLMVLRNRWKSWEMASRAYNGNPTKEITLSYIQKITAYEGLISQLFSQR